MRSSRNRTLWRGAALVAAAGLALAGCTNEGNGDEGDSTAAADDSTVDTSQQIREGDLAEGEGCTIDDLGVEQLDLADAKVGFSQSEPDSAAFRAAETQSIRDAAEEAGSELVVTNANNELPKQINDIQDMLNQGIEILVVAPVNSDGLDPALNAAKDQGVPVVTIDRKVNNEFCEDFLTFLGSDFYEQGERAADALADVNSEANVAILLGPSGNNVTDGRANGFKDRVAEEHPDITIVAEQTANASRSEGQEVTAQLLQSNPDIDAVYAFNDESGLGAMTAISEAGLAPGEDVAIVSVDGTRNAVEEIVNGNYNAVIESNPRFGSLVFETLERFYDGEAIAEDIIIEDGEYTQENAEEQLGRAF